MFIVSRYGLLSALSFTVLLAAPSVPVAIFSTATVKPTPPSLNLVAKSGDHLSGTHSVASFTIPTGVEVTVDDGFSLLSATTIQIDGTLLVSDQSAETARDSWQLVQLQANTSIEVSGRVLGGKGIDDLRLDGHGSNGSSISLTAPVVWIDGLVRGGSGGGGGAVGAKAKGGTGGSVDILGRYLTHHSSAEMPREWRLIVSGAIGGNGGFPAGDGGSVVAHGPLAGSDAIVQSVLGTQSSSAPALARSMNFAVAPVTCDNGANGSAGGTGTGGSGSTGTTGNDGDTNHPNGYAGGVGGTGGAITGAAGSDGATGQDCCPTGTGGAGGAGGAGGTGVGGPGGNGGIGGNGYSGGAGGRGGPGGSGGTGTGGKGGNGGNGGPKNGGAGTAGGAGIGSAGTGGVGGAGGSGTPNGPTGATGGGGGGVPGASGSAGSAGSGFCPQ